MTPQTRHTTLMVVIVLLLAAIAGVLVYQRLYPMTAQNVDTNAEIVVTAPTPDAVVKSPINLRGKALGTWYFEANMPVRVVDANGMELGTGYLTAEGEWMTTEFVPFGGVIEFKPSPTPIGFVVFHNDNPSGIPQYDKEYRVPVKFADVQ